jgi:hypothetical protein
MNDGSTSVLERDQSLGHPHRCRAGHRWQHAGPTAVTCTIPAYDGTGDLPFVSAQDCAVCCGRDDMLVRGVHTHYCCICDGDWDHEGRCLDGLPSQCPWCFPTRGSPAAGTRTGSHFHYCPACGASWRHTIACTAPFEAALPDCSGCFGQNERRHASPALRAYRVKPRALVRPLVVTASLAAGVLLSVPLGLKEWPAFWTAVPPIVEPPRVASTPASTEPEQARTEETPVVLVSPSEPTTLPRRESGSARRTRGVSTASTPRSRDANLPPRAIGPQPPDGNGATGSLPAAAPGPSPSTRASEPIVESAPETMGRLAAAPIEDSARPAVAIEVTEPSIPGAPPSGALGGASGGESFLNGHPRQIDRPARLENRSRY